LLPAVCAGHTEVALFHARATNSAGLRIDQREQSVETTTGYLVE